NRRTVPSDEELSKTISGLFPGYVLISTAMPDQYACGLFHTRSPRFFSLCLQVRLSACPTLSQLTDNKLHPLSSSLQETRGPTLPAGPSGPCRLPPEAALSL